MKIRNLAQLNEFLKSLNYNTFGNNIKIGFALRKSTQRIEENVKFFSLSEQGKVDIIVFVAEDKESNFEIRIIAPDTSFNGNQINEFANEIETFLSETDNLSLIHSGRHDVKTLLRFILVYKTT